MDSTAAIIGGGLSLLVWILFSAVRLIHQRKRSRPIKFGELMNHIGFGLLPGIAVWKIFEQNMYLSEGTPLIEPLSAVPFFTDGSLFFPCRIEAGCALACFSGIIIWLAARKEEIPGNGDLFLSVICLWGTIRCVTEQLRRYPLISAGDLRVMPVIFYLLAAGCFTIWTIRKKRATENSTATIIAESVTAAGCGIAIILNSNHVFTVGSEIGDFMLVLGCGMLMAIISLLAGKDSRE